MYILISAHRLGLQTRDTQVVSSSGHAGNSGTQNVNVIILNTAAPESAQEHTNNREWGTASENL